MSDSDMEFSLAESGYTKQFNRKDHPSPRFWEKGSSYIFPMPGSCDFWCTINRLKNEGEKLHKSQELLKQNKNTI